MNRKEMSFLSYSSKLNHRYFCVIVYLSLILLIYSCASENCNCKKVFRQENVYNELAEFTSQNKDLPNPYGRKTIYNLYFDLHNGDTIMVLMADFFPLKIDERHSFKGICMEDNKEVFIYKHMDNYSGRYLNNSELILKEFDEYWLHDSVEVPWTKVLPLHVYRIKNDSLYLDDSF